MSTETDAKVFVPKARARLLSEVNDESTVSVLPDTSKETVQEFVERKDLLISSLEYPRNGNNPGLVLIFNQEQFEDIYTRTRYGSRRDVNEIVSCMSRLGFNINEDHIFTDYKRDEIIDVIDGLQRMNLEEANSLIVFFLTHGDCFNQLHAKDSYIQGFEIWDKISKYKNLKGKPKMFVFQACKGENHSSIAAENQNKIVLVPEATFRSDYIAPDMLIVYSTTEGNVSFRNRTTGSWFIQELCKNFTAYGRRDDVISLIIRTTKCVSGFYHHVENDKLMKQMPVFISTLTKKFYLNRNKDRSMFLYFLLEQEKLKEHVEDLRNKVDELIKERNNKKDSSRAA